MQPDMVLWMSDQHAPQFMAGAEMEVDTPNLDALRREGTSFSEAYTACPLCVPARMAMLSGMRAASCAATGEHLARTVQAGAIVFSAVVCVVLALCSGLAGLNLGIALLYQLAWCALTVAMAVMKKP